MRVVLWDEFDVEPDVERAPRFYCADCRHRTLFSFDMDGARVCRECNEDALAELEH